MTTRVNAEAIRPGSVIQRGGVYWKVTANDTLARVLVLEEVGADNMTHQSYEPGVLIDCSSIPHHRQEQP